MSIYITPRFFDQSADAILEGLAYLHPKELEAKRLVSRRYNDFISLNYLWNKFLKEEYQITKSDGILNARDVFIRHPECRLDQYVGVDKIGRKWQKKFLMARAQELKSIVREPADFMHDDALCVAILCLISAKILTMEHARKLSLIECTKLKQTVLLILENQMQLGAVDELTRFECRVLEMTAPLILANKLTIDEAKKLTLGECDKLIKLVSLINKGKLTVEEVLTSNHYARLYALAALIDMDKLTVEEVMQLTAAECRRLCCTVPFISANQLTITQAKKLDESTAIEYQHRLDIAALIISGQLTLDEAKQLTPEEHANVKAAAVLIEQHRLTLEEAKNLSLNGALRGKLPILSPLILANKLTIEMMDALTGQESWNLRHTMPLILNGWLTVDMAKTLAQDACENLRATAPLIMKNVLDIEIAITLTTYQLVNLHSLIELEEIDEHDIELALKAVPQPMELECPGFFSFVN